MHTQVTSLIYNQSSSDSGPSCWLLSSSSSSSSSSWFCSVCTVGSSAVDVSSTGSVRLFFVVCSARVIWPFSVARFRFRPRFTTKSSETVLWKARRLKWFGWILQSWCGKVLRSRCGWCNEYMLTRKWSSSLCFRYVSWRVVSWRSCLNVLVPDSVHFPGKQSCCALKEKRRS